MDVTRRNFMKLVGTAAAAVASVKALPRKAAALASGPDTAFWQTVRNSFILDPKVLYMNIGTTGSTPRHVLQAYDDNNRLIASNPRENLGGTAPMRATVAASYGVDEREIVITSNTTDGMCMSIHGLTYDTDDEIITTIHEHPGGLGPMTNVSQRFGIPIRYVRIPVGPDQTVQEYVDAFAAAIAASRAAGRNPKTMVFSHITYKTGTLLPAKELCALARAEGMRTVIDGAHATGMMNLDWLDMGVDFYAASGHKWQCGPGGTGIWYVRHRQTHTDSLPLPEVYGILTSGGPRARVIGGNVQNFGAFLQSHGNPNYPALQAQADVCAFWQQIGRQRIEDHDLALAMHCKQRLADAFGPESLTSPLNPALNCGLTSFNPFDAKRGAAAQARVNEFVTRLREEYGIVIRSVNFRTETSASGHAPLPAEDMYTLRVSTHLFHNMGDVDRLVDSAVDLVNRMGV